MTYSSPLAKRRDRNRSSAARTHAPLTTQQQDRHPDAPKTRGDCVDGPRPCPWAGCRHHLWVHVIRGRSIQHALAPPSDLTPSCSLDVADAGPMSLEAVGELIGGVTKERTRQIEAMALRKVKLALNGTPWVAPLSGHVNRDMSRSRRVLDALRRYGPLHIIEAARMTASTYHQALDRLYALTKRGLANGLGGGVYEAVVI